MSRLLSWRSILSLILEIALLCVLIAAFFVRTPQVSGRSMEPQIDSGEYVLIDTLAYRFMRPTRGDIVAFRHGDSESGSSSSVYIKRIIGIPGNRIEIRRGIVFVNGRRIREPYVRFRDRRSFPATLVPPNSVYVLGDNRADSEDSRVFGCVPESALIGKALAGIWPPGALHAL
ncbi:MAG TPA: signal peptidase I [Candidatus Tyrphobacter sp.]